MSAFAYKTNFYTILDKQVKILWKVRLMYKEVVWYQLIDRLVSFIWENQFLGATL